jgi:hypothetical protein
MSWTPMTPKHQEEKDEKTLSIRPSWAGNQLCFANPSEGFSRHPPRLNGARRCERSSQSFSSSSSKSTFLPRFVSDRRLRLSAKIHSEDRSQPSCQYPSFEDDEDDYDPLQSYPSSSNLLAPSDFRSSTEGSCDGDIVCTLEAKPSW